MRAVHWNKDFRFCVIQCKKDLYVMTKAFKKVARIQESIKILHGTWTKDNIFIYSTYNHIKYALPNGDKGILRSLSDIQYPVALVDNQVITMNHEDQPEKFEINKAECLFKLSLWQNDISAVKAYIK